MTKHPEDFLKKLMEHAAGMIEVEKERVEVGRIDASLLKEFRAFDKEKERLDEDLDLRMEQEVLKLKRLLDDEFSERKEEIYAKNEAIWSKVHEALDLDPKPNYSIDKQTGMVFKGGDVNIKVEQFGDNPLPFPFPFPFNNKD